MGTDRSPLNGPVENADRMHEAEPACLGPLLLGVKGDDWQEEADREADEQPGILPARAKNFDRANRAPEDGSCV